MDQESVRQPDSIVIKAREAVKDVFHHHWREERGFPVDPFYICNKIGIKALQTELPPNVSGAFIQDREQNPIIVLHNQDSRRRQRFTCAHELGHYMDHAISGVLPDQYPFGFVDYRNTPFNERWDKPSERFADSFAANLLMPADDVRKFHREGRSLIALTSIFEVSEETMKLRLMKLGLELPVHK